MLERQLAYQTVRQSRPGRHGLCMRLQCGIPSISRHMYKDCFDKNASLLMIACVRAGRGNHVIEALEAYSL